MKEKDSKLATGLSFILFGMIILLEKIGFFNAFPLRFRIELLDWRSFIIYAATIFLLIKKDKTIGLALMCVGLLLRFGTVYNWLLDYSRFTWPIIFFVAGLYLLIGALRK